ncbi:MAG: hypothetical protein R2705_00120 [Ilumatobacteraceae bacterium]
MRFLGGPLALLPAIEHFRRHRRLPVALGVAAACVAPTFVNVVLAGAAGGGHTTSWHGIDAIDLRLTGRSLAGMLDATTGDLARTLLRVGDQLPWWGYVVALAWVIVVVIATAQFLGVVRGMVPVPVEICFTMAGLLTATLFAGIGFFDALATPDNRIMLPAGLLSLVGIVWSIEISEHRTERALAVGVLAVWAVTAVRPWGAGTCSASRIAWPRRRSSPTSTPRSS